MLAPSITARLLTTTLLRLVSSFITLNSRSIFSRWDISLNGRTSTREPGKNALNPLSSTVKPPFTLPVITPITVSFDLFASSSSNHTSALLAFSLESLVAPNPSSTASNETLTSSPTTTSISPLSLRNCSAGITPSDFRPA